MVCTHNPLKIWVVLRILQVLISFLITKTNGAYATTLRSGAKECIIIRAPPTDTTISGNFDCLDDELPADPVSVSLENSQKILWSSRMGDSEGTFEIEAEEGGLHRFCLENGKRNPSRDNLDRNIGWAIRVTPSHPRSLRDDEQGPDALRAVKLADEARELQEAWETLLDHYGFLRTREAFHNTLSNQIMTRVVRWTFLEGMVLVLIAGGQILYLRKFMETRRYL
mmetsp:Transcript_28120/g.31117  ORF Transcript_28120/g.31117 Transcript_28120/m.31117 type:complete len:225 (+) Transcript_28120:65-739(+)